MSGCEDCPTRRQMICLAGGAVAATALAGCGDTEEELDVLTQDLDIILADHPELEATGESVTIDAGLRCPIAVTRTGVGDDEFMVTGTECNHMNCSVNRAGTGWSCPCHGSRFTIDGALVSGPASAGLTVYDFEVSDGVMTVFAQA